jgi:hypothetical protein
LLGKVGELNPGIEVCVERMSGQFGETREVVSPANKGWRLNVWAAAFPHAAPWAGSGRRVSMATLCQILEDGSMAGQWELGGQPLVVGRDDAADAHVEDESVSRRHSIILREGENYIIEDLGSQNGTWVDGRRVLTARISHNARIVVGRTQFVFLERQPAPATVVRSPQRLTGSETPASPDGGAPRAQPHLSGCDQAASHFLLL